MFMSSIYTAMRKEHLSTWRLWYLINQRCDPEWRAKYIPHNTTFYDICDDWSREVSGEQGFINFMDDVGDLSAVENLHRIDTNKAYEPEHIGLVHIFHLKHRVLNGQNKTEFPHGNIMGVLKKVGA